MFNEINVGKEIILFLVIFVLVYLFYFIFVLSRKNVIKKVANSSNLMYLKTVYKIKITDKNVKKIANKVYLANAFILATTVTIIGLFKNFIIGLLISIIPLILLILLFYHIIGKYYQKKEGIK